MILTKEKYTKIEIKKVGRQKKLKEKMTSEFWS